MGFPLTEIPTTYGACDHPLQVLFGVQAYGNRGEHGVVILSYLED